VPTGLAIEQRLARPGKRRRTHSQDMMRLKGGTQPKLERFSQIGMDRLIRGACAGVIASTALEGFLYPLDTLKTRIQTRQEIRDSHWFVALFDGIIGDIVGMVPAAFIFFLVYEPAKALLLDCGVPPAACHLVSATFAILSSSTIQIPNDVVKIAMQSRLFSDKSARMVALHLFQQGGASSLYAGGWAWLMLHIPRIQMTYVIYEGLRLRYQRVVAKGRETTSLENSMLGAMQGVINGLLLTPVDTVRSRLMLQGARDAGGSTRTPHQPSPPQQPTSRTNHLTPAPARNLHATPPASREGGGVWGWGRGAGLRRSGVCPDRSSSAGSGSVLETAVSPARGAAADGTERKEERLRERGSGVRGRVTDAPVCGGASLYRGVLDTTATIVLEEGFLALFLGAGHRMVWMALRGAVFFSVLEASRRLLHSA